MNHGDQTRLLQTSKLDETDFHCWAVELNGLRGSARCCTARVEQQL